MNRKLFQLFFVLVIITAFGVIIKNYVDSIVSDIEDYKMVISEAPKSELSRLESITIRLAQNIDIQKFPINIPLEYNLLKFEPSVAGYSYFTNENTIEFQPNNPLKPGQEYTVTLNVHKIFPKLNKKPFRFRFSTPKLSFDVKIKELIYYDSTGNNNPIVKGNIGFNDFLENDRKKNILYAKQNNRPLSIKYYPGKNNKSIDFIISDIHRTKTNETIKIYWDGQSIKSPIKDSMLLQVVSQDSFQVASCNLTYFPKPFLTLKFTNPINTSKFNDSLVTFTKPLEYTINASTYEIKINILSDSIPANTLILSNKTESPLGKNLGKPFTYNFKPLLNNVYLDLKQNNYQSLIKLSNFLKVDACNLKSIHLEIIHVPDKNMTQFLQVNEIDGNNEIVRVGNEVFSKTFNLYEDFDYSPNRIKEYNLDLIGANLNENGLYQFKFWYSKHDIASPNNNLKPLTNGTDSVKYQNMVFSNIAAIAKLNSLDSLYIFVSDLTNKLPITGAKVELYDFQQNKITTLLTNANGQATSKVKGSKFFIRVSYNNEITYLKINFESNSLPINNNWSQTSMPNKGYLCFLLGLNKNYNPSDSLNIGIMLKKNGKQQALNNHLEIKLQSPDNKYLNNSFSTFNTIGIAKYKSTIPFHAQTGIWKLVITASNAEFIYSFHVSENLTLDLPIDVNYNEKKQILELSTESKYLSSLVRNFSITIENENFVPLSKYAQYTPNEPKSSINHSNLEISNPKFINGKTSIKLPEWVQQSNGLKITSKAQFADGIVLQMDTSIDLNHKKKQIGISYKWLNSNNLQLSLVEINNNNKSASPPYKIDLSLKSQNNSETSFLFDSTIQFSGLSKIEIPAYRIKSKDNLIANASISNQNEMLSIVIPHNIEKKISPNAFVLNKTSFVVGDTCIVELTSTMQGPTLLTIENDMQIIHSTWIRQLLNSKEIRIPITEEMLPGVYLTLKEMSHINSHLNSQYLSVTIPKEQNIKPLAMDMPYDWKPNSTINYSIANPNESELIYLLYISNNRDTTMLQTRIQNYFNEKQIVPTRNYSSINYLIKSGMAPRLNHKTDFNSTPTKVNSQFHLIHGPITLKAQQKISNRFLSPNVLGNVHIQLIAYQANTNKVYENFSTAHIFEPLSLITHQPSYVNADDLVQFPIEIVNNSTQNDTILVKIDDPENLDIVSSMEQIIVLNKQGIKTLYIEIKAKKLQSIGRFNIEAKSNNAQIKKHITIPIFANPNALIAYGNQFIAPHKEWQKTITPLGIKETNKLIFEYSLSKLPNLHKIINELDQNSTQNLFSIINKSFPLLYLNRICDDTQLSASNYTKINTALIQLFNYQTQFGGFSENTDKTIPHNWLTSYVGEFILKAQKEGYVANKAIFNKWIRYQKTQWQKIRFGDNSDNRDYGYLAYTLTLANAISLKELNQITVDENTSLTDRIYLANSYTILGKNKIARTWVDTDQLINELSTLTTIECAAFLILAKNLNQKKMVEKITNHFYALFESYNSNPTELSLSLNAILDATDQLGTNHNYSINYKVNNGKNLEVKAHSKLSCLNVPLQFTLSKNIDFLNTSTDTLYLNYWQTGNPQTINSQKEIIKGLQLSNEYLDLNNGPIKTSLLQLSMYIKQIIILKNTSSEDLDLSLTIPIPASNTIVYCNLNQINLLPPQTSGMVKTQLIVQKGSENRIVLVYQTSFKGKYTAYPIVLNNNHTLNEKHYIAQPTFIIQ